MIQKIKKPVSILLTVLMVFSVFAVVPFTASAASTGSFGSLTWNLDDDGTLTFSGSGSIPNYGFDWSSMQIKKIIINDSVTALGDCAFRGCTKLTEVVFESNPVLDWDAFGWCYALESVTLPQNMETIGPGMFIGCTSLKTIELPATIKKIDSIAFSQSALESLTVPEGVEIEENAFNECASLQSLVLESSTPVSYTAGYLTTLGDVTTVTVSEGSHYDRKARTDYNLTLKEGAAIPEWMDPEMLADIVESANWTFNDCIEEGKSEEEALAEASRRMPSGIELEVHKTEIEAYDQIFRTGDTCPDVFGGATLKVALDDATIAAINAINAIGTVELTDACKEKIDAARAAYDALNDVQKTFVPDETLATLEAAEDAMKVSVKWIDGNGNTLKTEIVTYGTTPEYNGATPTKAEDETNTYTFSGWTPAVAPVNADTTYTAKFDATPKHQHDGITFEKWTSNNSLPAVAGNYVLTSDVTLSGTWTVPAGETNLCLAGYTIRQSGSGSVIRLNNVNEKLTVYDDGTTGTITGGNTDGNGGGVNITEGTFTLKGGNIEGNVADNGGGISVYGELSYFIMAGGTVRYNAGYTYTGGVLQIAGHFTMTGGTIQNNVGKVYGGVGIADAPKPSMSGNAVVKDNVIFGDITASDTKITKTASGYTIAPGGTPCDVKHADALKINVIGAFENGAQIGITMDNPGVFTETDSDKTSFNDPTKFFSDDSNYGVLKNADGQLYLGVPPVASVTDGGTVTYYSSLKDAITAAPNGSTVTLLKDVTETQTAYANNNNTYGGNGNVISGKTITITSNGTGSDRKTVTGSRFDVINGGNVTFTNIIIDGGVADSAHKIINNNNSWSYYFMVVSYGSTLTFDTGATVQNYYANAHGVIDVGNGRRGSLDPSNGSSTINIKNGSEFKNLGANYGVFREDYKSTINMSGGSVTNCTSFADEGVCAYVAQGSAFNMTGGEITGCSPEGTAPGLIFLHDGQANGKNTFTMTGGTISGNTAKLGGAVYSHNNKNTVTVGGSAVATGNTGTQINGGQTGSSNFYLAAGQTMTLVSDNHLSGDSLIGIYSATAPSDSADVMIATGAVKEDIKHIHSDLPGNAGVIYCDGGKDWIWYNDEFVEVSCYHTSHQNGTVWLSTAVNTYDVTFDTDGGTPATIPAQTVVSNSKATKPTDPTKDGYVFDGWYNGDTKFNFDTPITANTNLKAKWKPKTLIAGHTLSLDGNIGINFYLDPTVAGLTVGQVTKSNLEYSFEWANGNALVEFSKQAEEKNFIIAEKNGVYYIKVTCHVCAAEMTCGVKASFTIGNKTETETYSVRKYADEILSDSNSTDELKNLTKAMLNYGAKAQIKFGIKKDKPEDLANYKVNYNMENVTGDMIDEAVKKENGEVTATNLKAFASAHGAKWYTTSLVYLDDNTLRHYFVKDTDAFKPSDYAANKGNYYYVEVSGIQAKNLDKWQTFKVGNDEFKYSALDFAKLMINSNSDDASKNLAKALYWYNQAANEYWKGRA